MAIYNMITYGGGGGGVKPSGTLSITANGTYDIASYASANVNVNDIRFKALVEKTITEAEDSEISGIGSHTFMYCLNLVKASFPNATYIAFSAFYGCESLSTLYFPNVKYIGPHAFAQCYGLTSVGFPKATTIGADAFELCRNLSTLSFPNVESIDTSAFVQCYGLTSVGFPKATTIGADAFRGCRNLSTVSFPNVELIDNSAFFGCESLITASFPNVHNISSYAFVSCYNLKSIYLMSSRLVSLMSDAFRSTPIGGYSASAGQYGSVYVPSSLWSRYQTALNWSSIASRIVSM